MRRGRVGATPRVASMMAVVALTAAVGACGSGSQTATSTGTAPSTAIPGPDGTATATATASPPAGSDPTTTAVEPAGPAFSRDVAVRLLANPLTELFEQAQYETRVPAPYSLVTRGQLDLVHDRFETTSESTSVGEAENLNDPYRFYGEGDDMWETWTGRDGWLHQHRYPLAANLPFPMLIIVARPENNSQRPPYVGDRETLETVVDAYLTDVEPGPPAEIGGRLCAHATLTFDGRAAGPLLPPALYEELGRWDDKDVKSRFDLYHDAEGRPCRLEFGATRMDLWGFDEPVDIVRPPDLPARPPGSEPA